MSFTSKLIDFSGKTAVIFNPIAPAGNGFIHEGVCPLVPQATKFWTPPSLTLNSGRVFVTLSNPPDIGLCPQVSSVIYPVTDKFVAEVLWMRDAVQASQVYGVENNKFIQLSLPLLDLEDFEQN